MAAPHGGIRPAQRRRSRLALALAEREVISKGVTAHQSARSIARLLDRSPSTASREMSRNGGGDRYRAALAGENAWTRPGRASASLDDGSGGAETLGGRDPGTGDRTSDSAKPLAGAPHPRKPRRSQSPASRPIEDHPSAASVNPDASLYCSAPGNDALARHGRAAHDGWSGSAVRRRPACGAALAARSRRRNKLGRGRNSCRSRLRRDNPRKEIVEPALRHRARTRKRQVDERHDCQDNHPAYVPSTVWGTASRRNSHVGLGAVLALDNEQALIAPSTPRQPRPAGLPASIHQ